MLNLGSLSLDAPFYQAGLAGYSDAAMRRVARRHGAPYAVTEAMLDMFLINGGKGVKAAELHEEDHPIAGQLMGSHPLEIAQAARVLVGLGYDVIDVNLACPVKKIKKRSRGGHLLSEPEEAIAILDTVRQAVPSNVPCSVKLRRAYDDQPESLAKFHRIIQAAIGLGYASATVHGRTVEQKYVGPANWDFLADIAKTYGHESDFVLGGSGDIWSAQDVFRMIEQTGVRLVSVARGCIGNPWIFTQARAWMAGDREGATRPPTLAQQRQVLMDHFHLSLELHGDYPAAMMMRKFGIKFARHHPQSESVAKAFIAVECVSDWHRVLDRYYPVDSSTLIPSEVRL